MSLIENALKGCSDEDVEALPAPLKAALLTDQEIEDMIQMAEEEAAEGAGDEA